VADVGQNLEYRLREALSNVLLVPGEGKKFVAPGPRDGDRAWQRIQWRNMEGAVNNVETGNTTAGLSEAIREVWQNHVM
jgi:hypothetical protein